MLALLLPKRVARRSARGRRDSTFLLAALLLNIMVAFPVAASHDPNRTITIYVHGFDRAGADRHGVYGVDIHATIEDSIAAMGGLPVASLTDDVIPANAVMATTYYGDTAPSYFTAADRAEVDRLTSEWGGGVPRYAYIVARYAQDALAASGADQVNFVGASFGTLIVRWLIEKNVAGLAGEGRIARWLTIEGLVAGNWEASRDDLRHYLDFVMPEPIDVDHMNYAWVATHLHFPRTEGDNPLLARILVGHVASTDDAVNSGVLSAAMLSYQEYMPNDGVQALPDARFQTMTARSCFLGMPPTLALFHADHLGITHHAGAWAEAATFITQRRRVTVRMTRATVMNLREPHLPYWNWLPAEVVFESSVHSPAVLERWGIDEPLSAHLEPDATAPLRRFNGEGESQAMSEVVFDDLVLAQETQLRLDLHAEELDYDPYYGVFETATAPYVDDMGGGSVMVSTLHPGIYSFAAPDWSCELTVTIVQYPFATLVDVPVTATSPASRRLVVTPNPASSDVRILLAGAVGASESIEARLEIADVSGRVIRTIEGMSGAGFLWDGRDARGRGVPAGIYFYRAILPNGVWQARSCRR